MDSDSLTSMYHFSTDSTARCTSAIQQSHAARMGKNEIYEKPKLSQPSSYENRNSTWLICTRKSRSRRSHGNPRIPTRCSTRCLHPFSLLYLDWKKPNNWADFEKGLSSLLKRLPFHGCHRYKQPTLFIQRE